MKMKKSFRLLGLVGCSTLVSGSNFVIAADPPETTKKTQVVIVHKDGEDGSSVRDQVSKELDKANVSDELKKKILEKIEAGMVKVEAAKASKPKVANQVVVKEFKADASKQENGKSEDVTVTVVGGSDAPKEIHLNGSSELPALSRLFKARVMRPASNDSESFRIGIALQQLSDEDGEVATENIKGLRIESVMEGSPAEKAGIKKGDVVVTVNAKAVADVSELMSAVQEAGKNDKDVSVELSRDEKTVKVEVKPTKMKSADVEMDDIRLTLPEGGFVVDTDLLKSVQGFKVIPQEMIKQGFSFEAKSSSNELKKEIDELKGEISELKKLVKELIDKK
jgi:membrane-associated protease RseP (regulator of RpoE activity)